MTFAQAILAAFKGKHIKRKAWNEERFWVRTTDGLLYYDPDSDPAMDDVTPEQMRMEMEVMDEWEIV